MNTAPRDGEKPSRGIPGMSSSETVRAGHVGRSDRPGSADPYPNEPDPDDPYGDDSYLEDSYLDELDDHPFDGLHLDDPPADAGLDQNRDARRLRTRSAWRSRDLLGPVDNRRTASGRADILPWWQPFSLGALAVAFGVTILSWPDIEVTACSALVGAWLLAAGVARIAGAVRTKEARGAGEIVFSALLGVLFVIGGVVCLRGLLASVMLLVVGLALAWLLTGFADLMIGLSRHHPGRGWMSVSGLLGIAAGVGFLLLPDLLLSALLPVAGKSALAVGVLQMAVALGVRHASRAYVRRHGRADTRGHLARS